MPKFTKLHLTHEIFRTCVFTILGNFTFIFSDSHEKFFFGVITGDYLNLQPLKNVKRHEKFLRLFWYKVFVCKITEQKRSPAYKL